MRELHRRILFLMLTAAACLIWAQQQRTPEAPPPPNVSNDPLLRGFEFRSIGPATMMGRVDNIADSTNPPTAARRGRNRSISTRTPVSPISRSIRRIQRFSTRLLFHAAEHGPDTTAAVRTARFGRPPMVATHGPSSMARGGRN